MPDPSIIALDAKINSFITSQDKHNDKVTTAIEKMSDTMANLSTVHVEINHLSEKITHCEGNIESLNNDIKIMSNTVITNSIQADEYKHIKKIFMAFIITAVLGGGYMTKTTIDNSTKQTDAMDDIVKAIKDSK